MKSKYFIGVDVGTQGARAVLIDAAGEVFGSGEQAFPLSNQSREEQSPEQWWRDCLLCLQQVVSQVRSQINLADIKAIAVTSTSGTIIPLDKNNAPLYNAIMYSDPRSAEEASFCKKVALAEHSNGYTTFNASSGLPKMLWFIKRYPDKVDLLGKFIHAADFITGKLSGVYEVTDYTNALKSGYDVRKKEWPAYIWEKLPIQQSWLPTVQSSGTIVATLLPELAVALGLPKGIHVVTGMTDGCAAQIASGAVQIGDWNTTIGTTLVVKGVTTREIDDPHGRLYCHRHPEGYWMPGGASNTGADWVTRDFGTNLDELTKQAAALVPTRHMAWPLKQSGERFPFIAPQAMGFQPAGLPSAELFAACMEGVAYIERYAYEVITQLSGESVTAVFTAGGGSNSDLWLQIRSNVLQLPVYKMKHVTGAVGAAIIAASQTHFMSLTEAARALTQIEKEVYPQPAAVAAYQQNYQQFINILASKGYISKTAYA
ncbi:MULTISPECIES: FGGY-family carbohydrate kinase [Niastella]|uniref:FGGY-family carbohydrate kinase n=1 Tax=Niastella soli TaxID=2821487 RepID=A0ABS3Z1W3_9BACT|nr:FGGY-family carbohydrate kinase [Niastella soli]MBO9204143.1 FGGY-family carbohydrate kinase [Niastella soli]